MNAKDEQIKTALIWITTILKKHQIPFQIAGGLAARVYGATRPIFDIDIDIPNDKFEVLANETKSYITYGPVHFNDEKWDLQLMTLNYQGQSIDISGVDEAKIYDEKKCEWMMLAEDLSKVSSKMVLGLKLPVISIELLLFYKKILARQVDLQDLAEIEEKLKRN